MIGYGTPFEGTTNVLLKSTAELMLEFSKWSRITGVITLREFKVCHIISKSLYTGRTTAAGVGWRQHERAVLQHACCVWAHE